MNSATGSLLEVLDSARLRRFSGSVSITDESDTLVVWFVRGNLAHAENANGDSGWKALEQASRQNVMSVTERENDLPPERTIRVDTTRLLKAMRSTATTESKQPMHVPVPLHTRLQQRFRELKHRSLGLRSFESVRRSSSGKQEQAEASEDRVIIERDPRGATWIHQHGDRQLIVRADETVTTAELMWAGREMWKEFDGIINRVSENGQ